MNAIKHLKIPALAAFTALAVTVSPTLWPLTASAADEGWYPEKEHAAVDYAERPYTGYDISILTGLLDEFVALTAPDGGAQAADSAGALALYRRILDETDNLYTQYALLQIQYYDDVTDEARNAEMEEMELSINDISDRTFIALQKALSGPLGPALETEMTDAQIDSVTSYEAMSDREKELNAQEIRLVQQYDQAMMAEDSVTVDGKTWTLDTITDADMDDLDQYYSILTALLKKKNEAAGPIFMELVDIRTEIAMENGYESYADYAYDELYNRDFDTEEIKALYDVIQKKISPLFLQASILSAAFDGSDDTVDVSGEEILDTIKPYIGQVDPALSEAFEYMRQYHLYDIDDSDTKMDMAFTTGMYSYGDAFIFAQPYGTYQDYWTAIHEFGHYNATYHAAERGLFEESTLDVAEIHSQGLEVLFYDYMDDMFGSRGESLQMSSLLNMLYAITEGFKYDEFQQTVYGDPDMSLDEINSLAAKLEAEYSGLDMFGDMGDDNPYQYYWVLINHTFQSPMYYISYATSAMSALDIWGESMKNRQSAVDKYMTLSSMGYEVPYREALRESGLRDMLDEENISALSAEIYTALKTFGRDEEQPGADKETDADGDASGGSKASGAPAGSKKTPESTGAGADAGGASDSREEHGISLTLTLMAGLAAVLIGGAAIGLAVHRKNRNKPHGDGGQDEEHTD